MISPLSLGVLRRSAAAIATASVVLYSAAAHASTFDADGKLSFDPKATLTLNFDKAPAATGVTQGVGDALEGEGFQIKKVLLATQASTMSHSGTSPRSGRAVRRAGRQRPSASSTPRSSRS